MKVVSQPPGARIYINGKYIGETPLETERSDFVGTPHMITLRKKGYREITAMAETEIKPIPLIFGLFVIVPLFWCIGPEEEQSYLMEPEEKESSSAKPSRLNF